MKLLKSKAYTLVELIVVITILAILGTIAFINLQSYNVGARDTKRLSDLNNIYKKLSLERIKGTKSSNFMLNGVDIKTGLIIGGLMPIESEQGTVNFQTLKEDGNNFKDPNGYDYVLSYGIGGSGTGVYNFIQLATVNEEKNQAVLVGDYYKIEPADSESIIFSDSSNTGSLLVIDKQAVLPYEIDTSLSLQEDEIIPIPTYDETKLQFLGFDKNVDGIYENNSTYSSGWINNNCNSNSIPVFLVLNPSTYFSSGITLDNNTIYKVANGTYNIAGSTTTDGHIKLGNCTGIIGESKTGVVLNANLTGGSTSATGGLLYMSGSQNNVLANFTINGNKTGTYKYKEGITVTNNNNSTFDNITVTNTQNYGIILRNSLYNNLTNLNTNNNGSVGLYLYNGSSYNFINNLISYGNSNGSSGYGIYLSISSNYNKIDKLLIYNNQTYGLAIMNQSNNNNFTDLSLNKNGSISGNYSIVINDSNNNILKDFELYNAYGGIYMTGATNTIFNNFQLYNNRGRPIDSRYSSENSFNNFLVYNNGAIAVEIEYGLNNYFNNLFTFNNKTGQEETPLSFRFYNTNYGTIKDYRAYNNLYYGCLTSGSSNISRSGIYKIFAISNNSTTSCGGTHTGNDGTAMSCSWHVQPSWMGTNLGINCENGYYSNSYIGTSRASYTFGSNIANQIQPVKWDSMSNGFVPYGTNGVDYDSSKKIGQW